MFMRAAHIHLSRVWLVNLMWVYNGWKTGTLPHCPIVTIVHVMEGKWQNGAQNHYTPMPQLYSIRKENWWCCTKNFSTNTFNYFEMILWISYMCANSTISLLMCVSHATHSEFSLISHWLYRHFDLILCSGVIFSKSYPLRFLRFSLCLASFCPLRLP